MRLHENHGADAPAEKPGAAIGFPGDSTKGPVSASSGYASVPASYGKRTSRWTGVLAMLVIVGLGGGFVTVSKIRARDIFELEQETQTKTATLPLVDVAAVKAGPPYSTLVLPGETAAWYRTTIYSRVSGYLADWQVDIGDRVKKGQVLAVIDTPDLDAQLDAARAKLKAAEAEVKVKHADADFARSSYDRWRDSPKGVVSDQEREAKKAADESGVAQLNAALAQVAVDQAKVDGLTTLTQFKNVTAPFEGIITERRVDPGDLVTAGSSASTTPLFVLQQTDRIRVFADVPQGVSSRLIIGSFVKVTTADGTGRMYKGTISRMSGSLDPRARTMRIEADLPNPDYALPAGMYVRVELQVGQKSSVQVPASALVFRAKGPQVAVVQKDGTVAFRNVNIVSDDGDFVYLGSGVNVGDDVALNISSQISQGEKVAIANSSGAES